MIDNNQFSLDNINLSPDFNFSHTLSHTEFILDDNDDSPYNNIAVHCKYLDESQFIARYHNTENLSYLSLNIQSLPAKFDELYEFIVLLQNNNCAPDVILLQEIWQIIDPDLFDLPGYHSLIYKTRHNAQGGGVGLYVKDNLHFNLLSEKSIFIDRILESIFIEIWTSKNKKNCNRFPLQAPC